ncbi:MAG: hypothetical protein IPO58_10420 [Betaproteobacteria bacterium]|nr:hypothetical protein [Betaproteobacteria bacterium]
MKTWQKAAALLALGTVVIAGLAFEHRRAQREQARQEQAGREKAQREHDLYFAGCPTVGRLDRIVAERVGTGEGTLVQGWLIAPGGGAQLRLDGTETAFPLHPSEERQDVRGEFPQCKAAAASGFSVRLPGDAQGATIRLLAQTAQGMQVLEEQKYAVSRIRVEIDPMGDIEPNGRNIVSGWAISADGAPVTVEFVGLDRVIASAPAKRSRTDALAAHPALPHAANSGFDARISFADLPRGNYRLRLRAASGSQPPLEVDGPLVRNDHPFGLALTLKQRAGNPRVLKVAAWLAHESGIKSAQFETEEGTVLGNLRRQRSRVRFGTLPRDLLRDAAAPIAVGSVWSAARANTLPAGIHRLQIRVKAADGAETVIPAQLVANSPASRDRRHAGQTCQRDPLLVFYPAGPGTIAGLGTQREALSLRDLVDGPCVRTGMRIRVEYLRTTRGRDHDYAFDPTFKSARVRVPGKSMTTAGLDEALQLAARHHMPLLVSLDGGVWADSAFAAPEWDVVDHLEDDENAVQWNQSGRSERDDALANMPGATSQPQVARMLSLNVYNERFRAYKKRNLQAAVAHIARHLQRHPKHAVWINLDSDNYINPWFKETQWYDYNPATLRQFREWLTGDGPYAAGGQLAEERLSPSLDLAAINRIAKAGWSGLADVDAPRGPLAAADPWQGLWTRFKRHLVARHYSDLSDWACQAGLPADHIYTAVGIADNTVARELDDRIRGWNDQSGVSLRGGKPHCGHLGVVMYGPVTRNETSAAAGGAAPLDSIMSIDPSFGVVEFHPADLDSPTRLPGHEESRKSLLGILNAGARFISPMWGMIASGQTLFPAQFHAYEAMEGTAFETELVRVLREWNVVHARPGPPPPR